MKLNDDSKIRLKTFVVTPMRIHTTTKKLIRAAMKAKLEELVEELSFPAFVNKLITYEMNVFIVLGHKKSLLNLCNSSMLIYRNQIV